MMKNGWLITIILFLCCAIPSFAQQKENLPPLQYRTEVRLLQVEVFVYNKNKEFVPGLTRNDFILHEDGKKQEIRYVDEINITTAQQLQTTSKTAAEPGHAKPLNSIIFLFDKGHISQLSAPRIKDSAKKFIAENSNEKNRMALFTMDNNGSYEMIKKFSDSPEELLSALDQLNIGAAAINSRGAKIQIIQDAYSVCTTSSTNDGGSSRVCNNPCDEGLLTIAVTAAKGYSWDEKRTALNISQSLTAIFRFLQHVPGQKSILFFSEGFDPTGSYYYSFLWDAVQHCRNFNDLERIISVLKDDTKTNIMNELTKKANVSGLTFYWLNPQDPNFILGADSNIRVIEGTGTALRSVFYQLKNIADDTGGFSMQTAFFFDEYFNKLNKNLSHYYIISYTPKRRTPDSKAHKIKVKPVKPDIKVTARKAITDFSDKDQIDIMLASALDFPELAHQIPATTDYMYFMDGKGKITATVSIVVPLTELISIGTGDNFIDEVHFAYLVRDEKDIIISREHKIANVNLPLTKYNEMVKDNSTFQNLHSFQLKPGVYTLYAAILEAGGWKFTGWKAPLSILNDKKCLTLGPLILASRVENIHLPPGTKSNPSVLMQSDGTIKYKDKLITFSAIKNLPASGQLVGLCQIFNAYYTPESKASLKITFKLYDDNNNLINSLPPKEINDFTDFPNKLITNFFILPYKNLAANKYHLVLEAKDSLSLCNAESHSHFTVK